MVQNGLVIRERTNGETDELYCNLYFAYMQICKNMPRSSVSSRNEDDDKWMLNVATEESRGKYAIGDRLDDSDKRSLGCLSNLVPKFQSDVLHERHYHMEEGNRINRAVFRLLVLLTTGGCCMLLSGRSSEGTD